MKTAGRHPHANARPPRYKNVKTDAGQEPDRIIMPAYNTHSTDGSSGRYGAIDYEFTDFEVLEAASSSVDDEIAFQEFADEDPTRLRMGRGGAS